jgi:hypothetical protein
MMIRSAYAWISTGRPTALAATEYLLLSKRTRQVFDTDAGTEAEARATLQQFDPLWGELFPAEQARIVALLVEGVDIGTDGLNVRLRVDGLGGLAREMLAGGIGEAA